MARAVSLQAQRTRYVLVVSISLGFDQNWTLNLFLRYFLLCALQYREYRLPWVGEMSCTEGSQ